MDKRYDLFELPIRGFPQWLDSASNLDEATDKMRALPPIEPGAQYLVRDFYSGSVVAYTLPEKTGTVIFSQPTPKHPGGPVRSVPAAA
jgi:hypothetical protein